MANTFTQLYVQMVFAVKNRETLIFDNNKTYIENQREHHRKYRFKDEYIAFY
jgi:hypothetical protein